MNDKVYIAGPLFTQGDRWFLEKIDELLQNHGFVTYLPHRDGGLCPSDGRDIKLSRCSIRPWRCRQGWKPIPTGRHRSFSTRWIIVTGFWYSRQDDCYLIANFSAFSGLPVAFVVLCVLTKEVRTMARITAKEYVAARQMKKNGDCISGDKPGGAVSVCITGEGVKSNE